MSDDEDPLLVTAGLSGSQLDDLLALLGSSDITELDVTVEGTRLSLRRPAIGTADSAPYESEPPPAFEHDSASVAIASPLVGIFRPSVHPGEALQPGQSIGAIEALGMPTSVDAPHAGIVEQLLVANGAPVEFGQPLVLISRAQ